MLVRSRRWERPCPGDFGVLKAADPRQFLGPWLARRGVAVRGDPRRRRRWLPRGVPRLAAPLFALRTSGRAAACLRSLTRFEVMDGPFGCLCRRRRRLVRLAVRAGHHDGVPVGIPQPDLAMAGPVALTLKRVAVRWAYHSRLQLLCAGDDPVEVGHVTEPQQYAVPDLNEPALPVVELGPAAHGATVADHLVERGPQFVGADPEDRAGGAGGLEVSGPLADHSGRLEAAVLQPGRPAEHGLVEGRGPGHVERWELQISDLAVRRRLDPAVDVGSSHVDLLLQAATTRTPGCRRPVVVGRYGRTSLGSGPRSSGGGGPAGRTPPAP